MGINILIVNENGRLLEGVEWDSFRQGDDNRFSELLNKRCFPSLIKSCEYINLYKPVNFNSWNELIKSYNLEPKERYFKLLFILMTNPDAYIEISY